MEFYAPIIPNGIKAISSGELRIIENPSEDSGSTILNFPKTPRERIRKDIIQALSSDFFIEEPIVRVTVSLGATMVDNNDNMLSITLSAFLSILYEFFSENWINLSRNYFLPHKYKDRYNDKFVCVTGEFKYDGYLPTISKVGMINDKFNKFFEEVQHRPRAVRKYYFIYVDDDGGITEQNLIASVPDIENKANILEDIYIKRLKPGHYTFNKLIDSIFIDILGIKFMRGEIYIDKKKYEDIEFLDSFIRDRDIEEPAIGREQELRRIRPLLQRGYGLILIDRREYLDYESFRDSILLEISDKENKKIIDLDSLLTLFDIKLEISELDSIFRQIKDILISDKYEIILEIDIDDIDDRIKMGLLREIIKNKREIRNSNKNINILIIASYIDTAANKREIANLNYDSRNIKKIKLEPLRKVSVEKYLKNKYSALFNKREITDVLDFIFEKVGGYEKHINQLVLKLIDISSVYEKDNKVVLNNKVKKINYISLFEIEFNNVNRLFEYSSVSNLEYLFIAICTLYEREISEYLLINFVKNIHKNDSLEIYNDILYYELEDVLEITNRESNLHEKHIKIKYPIHKMIIRNIIPKNELKSYYKIIIEGIKKYWSKPEIEEHYEHLSDLYYNCWLIDKSSYICFESLTYKILAIEYYSRKFVGVSNNDSLEIRKLKDEFVNRFYANCRYCRDRKCIEKKVENNKIEMLVKQYYEILFKDEKYDRLIETCKIFIEQKFFENESKYYLGLAYFQKSSYKNALKYIEETIEIFNKNRRYIDFDKLLYLKSSRGRCYFKLGNYEKTKEIYDDILNREIKDFDLSIKTNYDMATTYHETQNYNSSQAYIKKVLNIVSGKHSDRINDKSRIKDIMAIEELEQKIKDKVAGSILLRGKNYYKQKNYVLAYEDFKDIYSYYSKPEKYKKNKEFENYSFGNLLYTKSKTGLEVYKSGRGDVRILDNNIKHLEQLQKTQEIEVTDKLREDVDEEKHKAYLYKIEYLNKENKSDKIDDILKIMMKLKSSLDKFDDDEIKDMWIKNRCGFLSKLGDTKKKGMKDYLKEKKSQLKELIPNSKDLKKSHFPKKDKKAPTDYINSLKYIDEKICKEHLDKMKQSLNMEIKEPSGLFEEYKTIKEKYEKALMYYERKDYQDTITYLSSIQEDLRGMSDNEIDHMLKWDIYYLFTKTYNKLTNYSESINYAYVAEDIYHKLIKRENKENIKNKYRKLLFSLQDSYFKRGDFFEAREILLKLLEHTHDYSLYHNFAKCNIEILKYTKHPELASKIFLTLDKAKPYISGHTYDVNKLMEAWLTLFESFILEEVTINDNNLNHAKNLYENIYNKYKDEYNSRIHIESLVYLSLCYYKTGKPQKLKTAKSLLSSFSNNERKRIVLKHDKELHQYYIFIRFLITVSDHLNNESILKKDINQYIYILYNRNHSYMELESFVRMFLNEKNEVPKICKYINESIDRVDKK